jgi:hypothetical protein
MYRQLNAYGIGDDCALIAYRNSKAKTDASNRRLSETCAGEDVQLDADRKWSPVALAGDPGSRRSCPSATVPSPGSAEYKHQTNGAKRNARGYADIAVGKPLTETESRPCSPHSTYARCPTSSASSADASRREA